LERGRPVLVIALHASVTRGRGGDGVEALEVAAVGLEALEHAAHLAVRTRHQVGQIGNNGILLLLRLFLAARQSAGQANEAEGQYEGEPATVYHGSDLQG